MARTHQPGQAAFKSILPEDDDWKPFPAFPPSVRLAVVVGEPSQPGPCVIRAKCPLNRSCDVCSKSKLDRCAFRCPPAAIAWSNEYFTTLVATLGTTISPHLGPSLRPRERTPRTARALLASATTTAQVPIAFGRSRDCRHALSDGMDMKGVLSRRHAFERS
jgi:hypothetical protein